MYVLRACVEAALLLFLKLYLLPAKHPQSPLLVVHCGRSRCASHV
jgi:hypothetical protein